MIDLMKTAKNVTVQCPKCYKTIRTVVAGKATNTHKKCKGI